MGGAATPGQDGGLNVELNLVPFIDLLSSLVLFLLLSAVWMQVASLQASVQTKGRTVASSAPPSKRLTVRLTAKGYDLSWPESAKGLPPTIAKKNEAFESEGLKQIVQKALAAKSIDSGAVAADETIPYGALIEALDTVKAAGVASVAVSTN